jgi:hypothetical protein
MNGPGFDLPEPRIRTMEVPYLFLAAIVVCLLMVIGGAVYDKLQANKADRGD